MAEQFPGVNLHGGFCQQKRNVVRQSVPSLLSYALGVSIYVLFNMPPGCSFCLPLKEKKLSSFLDRGFLSYDIIKIALFGRFFSE